MYRTYRLQRSIEVICKDVSVEVRTMRVDACALHSIMEESLQYSAYMWINYP